MARWCCSSSSCSPATGSCAVVARPPAGWPTGSGGFIDVFDPARARADQDLKSHQNQGAVIPNLEDDEPPVVVDLVKKVARIRLR
ncbi:hypothetical protein G5V59_25495 [Nocardioides sp. W3-2-3]|uniref:hypothetical protein n=1 Tax=Nocardioides convexus TaxID=2712224 RepID=UPI002418B69C|nr:hypothetical protein [Nocardioides convexus]NHA01869.1 hypothetical protein [Nocardioides convexus]